MHEELWAGVELKNEHAAFFLERMGQALAPPKRTQINVALGASGAIIGTNWQRSIYAYLDAFLAMARSVPEVRTAGKGVADAEGRPIVAAYDPSLQWAATLPPVAVEPRWTDFTIDGRPLFPECRTYLEEAAKLVAQGRAIANTVHGTESL